MNSKQRRKLLKKGYSRAAANEVWRKFDSKGLGRHHTADSKPKGTPFDVFLAGQPDHVLDIFLQDLQHEDMGAFKHFLTMTIAEIGKRAEKLLVTNEH